MFDAPASSNTDVCNTHTNVACETAPKNFLMHLTGVDCDKRQRLWLSALWIIISLRCWLSLISMEMIRKPWGLKTA